MTRCERIKITNHDFIRYEGQTRKSNNLTWIWVFKIATALASKQTSSVTVNELGSFFIYFKERIYNIIGTNEKKISLALV